VPSRHRPVDEALRDRECSADQSCTSLRGTSTKDRTTRERRTPPESASRMLLKPFRFSTLLSHVVAELEALRAKSALQFFHAGECVPSLNRVSGRARLLLQDLFHRLFRDL